MKAPIRIGNASGFYGDRLSGVREMLEGGPLDVLTGDYLAELTMLILARERERDPSRGYARTFLRQMEECVGLALDRGVRIVTNAGGVNPQALVLRLSEVCDTLGLSPRIAYVEGDDLSARASELGHDGALAVNAYLGAWGIAGCLRAGADVVVTGRVTDASLVVGPAAAHFGWAADDWDALAGATAAGHVLECGAQATGGNFSFFTEIDMGLPGFPIAEVSADGTSVITKHDGTGGAVTVETVTAQLVYEIQSTRYAGPDVTTLFDTLRLSQQGPDRVAITDVRGEPPPPQLKLSVNRPRGLRNEAAFVLTGLDIEAKAALVREQMEAALPPRDEYELHWSLARTERHDPDTQEAASVVLRCVAKGDDPALIGRTFSSKAVELALSSIPGFFLLTPPTDAQTYGAHTSAFVDAREVEQTAVLPDGRRVAIPAAAKTHPLAPDPSPALPEPPAGGRTRRVTIGSLCGARSGDKGPNVNVGVWARDEEGWRWLAHELTVDMLRRLLPEIERLPVSRHALPNLRAVNFVIHGMLGEGVAASTRFDPQGKGVAEWLRSREVEVGS